MNTLVKATRVHFDPDSMWVDLSDGRILAVPLAWFPRLLTLYQRLQLVVLLAPGANSIPSHAVIEGKGREDLITVPRKGCHVKVAAVKAAGLALRRALRHAEQEVGKVQAGLRAIEGEAAVENHVGVSVDPVGVNLAPRLYSMLAWHRAGPRTVNGRNRNFPRPGPFTD